MRTLKSKLILKGNGLMSNILTEFEICPSNTQGIRFHINNSIVEADVKNVVSTDHCVVLANLETGSKIALVEHFMAACAITQIDALDIFVKSEGFETPIFDGSAKIWVDEFNKTGYSGDFTDVQTLLEPIIFQAGKSSIVLMPSDKTTITYSVNFNHPELKNRWATFDEGNLDEIIKARTFGYLKDLETFQKMGFSKGVTYENTVGLTETEYTVPLNSEFEPIKHKILDIIGDFYLTGYNPLKLNATILVKEAGHGYHIACAKILQNKLKGDTK